MKPFLTAFAVLLLGMIPAAAQQDLPALYRVAGVAADDVLNVRAGPGPGHPVVATLPPDAAPVEAVARDPGSGWLLVNVSGQDVAGYASNAYLRRLPGPDRAELPLPLHCGGTEPFWGFSVSPAGSATFYDPDRPDRLLSLVWSGPASSRVGAELGAVLAGGAETVHAVLQRQECSDGMSDRAYGLKVDAIATGDFGTRMFTGCCALLR